MLEEFSNRTLSEEQVNQENFIDIMCKTYTEEQIIKQLYKTNLIKKIIDIETTNQFTIQQKQKKKPKNSFKWVSKYNRCRKGICKCKNWNSKV